MAKIEKKLLHKTTKSSDPMRVRKVLPVGSCMLIHKAGVLVEMGKKERDSAFYAYSKDRGLLLFGVFDGFGEHGFEASKKAADVVLDVFSTYVGTLSGIELLKNALVTANNELLDLGKTTATVVLVEDGVAFYAMCGDTPIFVINNRSQMIVSDEVLGIAERVETFLNRRHIIRNYIGKKEMYLNVGVIDAFSKIIIASDGFTDNLPVVTDPEGVFVYPSTRSFGMDYLVEVYGYSYEDWVFYAYEVSEGDVRHIIKEGVVMRVYPKSDDNITLVAFEL